MGSMFGCRRRQSGTADCAERGALYGRRPSRGRSACPGSKPGGRLSDILFISRQRITGRTNGSSTYLLELAAAARRAGFVPHLLQPSPTIMGRSPAVKLGRDLDVFASHRVRGVLHIGRWLISRDPTLYRAAARAGIAAIGRRSGLSGGWTIDRPNPHSVGISWTAADRAFVRRHSRGAAVALADYVFQAEAFTSLSDPRTATAIIMHDLFHARPTSGAGGGSDSAASLDREAEIELLGRGDAVIAIQAAEAAFVAEHQRHVRVITAPMAAHVVDAPAPGTDGTLLFVGSNTAPNVVGLQWFFDQVWPALRARDPDIRLDVVGTVARAFPGGGREGVRFAGLVDDLDGALAQAGVVISPLTFGSGLKIKLIEAMAAGKAIVATGVTLQGVEQLSDAVIRADDPATFADAVATLARKPAERAQLGAAALDAARSRFSPEACYGPFVAWLREVTGR